MKKLTIYAGKNNIPDYLYDPDDTMSRKFRMTYGGGVVFVDRAGIVRQRVPKGFSPAGLELALKKILENEPADHSVAEGKTKNNPQARSPK